MDSFERVNKEPILIKIYKSISTGVCDLDPIRIWEVRDRERERETERERERERNLIVSIVIVVVGPTAPFLID
jgi:hypothetical protein